MPTPILWPIIQSVAPSVPPPPVGTTSILPTDFGSDISATTLNSQGVPDLDPQFLLQTGNIVLAQAASRRLSSPRGTLYYDPNYGEDLRSYVNATMGQTGLSQLELATSGELLKDERIANANASASGPDSNGLLTEKVAVQTARGPFQHTLPISAVTPAIFNVLSGAPTLSPSGSGGGTVPITVAVTASAVVTN